MPRLRSLCCLCLALGVRDARAEEATTPIPAQGSVTLVEQAPLERERLADGAILFDFGRVAFGNVRMTAPIGAERGVLVRFGEAFQAGRIDREPPGTVRYSEVRVIAKPGEQIIVAPKADRRNTDHRTDRHPPAVLTPPEWGVVTPFRWVEIEGASAIPLSIDVARRAAFETAWDDQKAAFTCSNERLNRVWGLSHYSIKATTFAGVYVDGDRERIPYEADAYLNQIGHCYATGDVAMGRRTFDWLMEHPTWPTEWAPHMIFMAHADWTQTADASWLKPRYESLKSKALLERVGPDGLVHSDQRQTEHDDIIDWPPGERDGYVRTERNTVVNAFHYAAIERLAELADAVGAEQEAAAYRRRAQRVREAFLEAFYDPVSGRFRDGVGADHQSSHANLFPLAFGLAPEDSRTEIAQWLAERGMRCSVYAAQYLLEGLFQNGAASEAAGLIVAPGDRSWRHMVDSGATITWEAWNERAKPNLDWNHAWGAAPMNLLPRFVLGVQPAAPGWDRALVKPHPSGLSYARGVVPTRHGLIHVDWREGDTFELQLNLPDGVRATVAAPNRPGARGVSLDGRPAPAELRDGYWVLANEVTGRRRLTVR